MIFEKNVKDKLVEVVRKVIKKKQVKTLDELSTVGSYIQSNEDDSKFTEAKISLNNDKIIKPLILSNQGFEEFVKRFQSNGGDTAPFADYDCQLASPSQPINFVKLKTVPYHWKPVSNFDVKVDKDDLIENISGEIGNDEANTCQFIIDKKETQLNSRIDKLNFINSFAVNFQNTEPFNWDDY